MLKVRMNNSPAPDVNQESSQMMESRVNHNSIFQDKIFAHRIRTASKDPSLAAKYINGIDIYPLSSKIH